MNKSLLKEFAISSRKYLMDKIKIKLSLFYLDEVFSIENKGDIVILSNENHSISYIKSEYDKRQLLIKRIAEIGYDDVIEEAAYTWFNRLIAIRYMEIHDYLPLGRDNESLGIRVLSSSDNKVDPEILKFSNLSNPNLDINFNSDTFIKITNENDKYKYILQLVLNKIKKVIPDVFDGMTDYIDILIPDNLLSDSGFVAKIIKEVPEDNFNKVEIIGWLYQYYNQTEKERVMSTKKAYNKNEIAYVTQLFTPDWIVKYMVENTIGKYANVQLSDFTGDLKYFVNNNNLVDKLNVENIKFIDPCCGSGHILVYALEIYYKFYEALGYRKDNIVPLILSNNLYGLDIDNRAGQLSILSLLLKAREYDKNIFNPNKNIKLNLISVPESNNLPDYLLEEISSNILKEKLKKLVDYFKNGKEIGSLLIIESGDYSDLEDEILNNNTIFGLELKNKILPLIKAASILSKKYEIIVTNPPYMNGGVMPQVLKNYLIKNYSDSKTDLCTAFMEVKLLKENGLYGIINQHSWMFLSSFENLRFKILNNMKIDSMIHLGTRAFEEIGGEVVQTTTFIMQNKRNENDDTKYYRLVDINDAKKKEETFINDRNRYEYKVNNNELLKVPGYTFAYWGSKNLLSKFENDPIEKSVLFRQGMATSDNNRFLRFWFEVDKDKMCFNCNDLKSALNSKKKWFMYNKGGTYRKWYGNQKYVVNWENDGYEMKEYTSTLPQGMNVRLKSREYYFKECYSWSKISMSDVSFRYYPDGFAFDVAGCCVFEPKIDLYYLLGLSNSCVTNKIMSLISPTLNFELDHLKKLPLIYNKEYSSKIVDIVKENIELCKKDWDSFEQSWNFKKHPLIEYKGKNIEESFLNWEYETNIRFEKLKNNEEELNKIFLEIYGLSSELGYEVESSKISIKKADLNREIKSLISYAVGCLFGRYSIDSDKVRCTSKSLNKNEYNTIIPDDDNVLPIAENNRIYYSDDIVERISNFIKTIFGTEYFDENMDFISNTLGRKGTESAIDTLRRYMLNDFYLDHLKIYQKKPIYWLIDSGKKNGFKSYIYIHRYNNQLFSKIRVDYLHKVQDIYDRLKNELSYKIQNENILPNDRKNLQNELNDIIYKIDECNIFDEKISHLANQMIDIELDDGIKVNYEKLADVLAKIK